MGKKGAHSSRMGHCFSRNAVTRNLGIKRIFHDTEINEIHYQRGIIQTWIIKNIPFEHYSSKVRRTVVNVKLCINNAVFRIT